MKDILNKKIELNKKFITKICNRNFWIWSDGLLILDRSNKANFKYMMYNPDWSSAEMCGNWIRCFMKYLLEEWITNKQEISVETWAWILELKQNWENIIVDMWIPKFDKKSIWISKKANINGIVESSGRQFEYLSVSTWNPHAIIFVEDDLKKFDVAKYWAEIESNINIFTNKVNVSFVEKISDTEINHRVYERWAGETLACGTAVTWTVAAAIKQWILKADREIKVNLKAGILYIKWSWKENDWVIMKWPAEITFKWEYYF